MLSNVSAVLSLFLAASASLPIDILKRTETQLQKQCGKQCVTTFHELLPELEALAATVGAHASSQSDLVSFIFYVMFQDTLSISARKLMDKITRNVRNLLRHFE
jgi:hypothetical protein